MAFFGTPELALPTLDRLLEGRHEVVCVVSQPDRGRGRGRRTTPSPVAARALERGLPLLRPERVGDPETLRALAAHAPDVGVIVAFGQFVPRSVRELPRLGYLINAHASLLPRHRGASPIQSAILAGDRETGVSVMRVEREMDAGPVAGVHRTPLDPRENAEELGRRLAALAAEAITEALEQIAAGTIRFTPQDETRATVAPRLGREDARLDWREPTDALVRRIHALAPRPGAVSELRAGAGRAPTPLRILRAERGPDLGPPGQPGRVRLGRPGDGFAMAISTGDGWLVPLEVQRSGGRAMEPAAYLRGHALPDGTRLGADPAVREVGDA